MKLYAYCCQHEAVDAIVVDKDVDTIAGNPKLLKLLLVTLSC